jgi:hypothetical protein
MNQAIEAARHRPLDWGRHDCCLFAADVIAAMTGRDTAAKLRGRYRDVKGARRLIKARGGSLESLAAGMAKRNGWPEIDPKAAGRGDLVVLRPAIPILPAWPELLGICIGSLAAAPGNLGLSFVELARATRAWKV